MTEIHIPSAELLADQVPLRPVALCPEVTAHYSDDLYDLWRAWEAESGDTREIPYWCVVWPGAALHKPAETDPERTFRNTKCNSRLKRQKRTSTSRRFELESIRVCIRPDQNPVRSDGALLDR